VAHEARLTAVIGVALAVLAAGCEKKDALGDVLAEPSQRDCRMPFPEYDAGPEVAGIRRSTTVTNCGRRPFVTYVYGTCHATSDNGCSPPLQVQTWSACHRKPRAAPAGHDVALRRGRVTIVVFARSDRLAARAVALLRKAKPADPSLPLTRKLRGCGGR
jgi:hypothetical protein